MRFLTILFLPSVAFASRINLKAASTNAEFDMLLKDSNLDQCYQNQCGPIREKLQNDCYKIIKGKQPNSIDIDTAFKYSNCVCQSIDYIHDHLDCADCMNSAGVGAEKNLTGKLEQMCVDVDADPENTEEDKSSSVANVFPVTLLASFLLVSVGNFL